MHFAGWCTPWKVANGAENLVLLVLQFHKIGIYCELLSEASIGQ
jgi:hypothetical protein